MTKPPALEGVENIRRNLQRPPNFAEKVIVTLIVVAIAALSVAGAACIILWGLSL